MEIGFFHRATAVSHTGEASTGCIARLIAIGWIVLFEMRFDTQVDVNGVTVITQKKHFAAVGDEYERVGR